MLIIIYQPKSKFQMANFFLELLIIKKNKLHEDTNLYKGFEGSIFQFLFHYTLLNNNLII